MDLERHQLWLLNVFGEAGGTSLGNPTGVVIPSRSLSRDEEQALATRLGYSHTAFLQPEETAPRVIHSYSPEGRLGFSVQSTLALAEVLRRVTGGSAPAALRTGDHTLGVELCVDGDRTEGRVLYPRRLLEVEEAPGIMDSLVSEPGVGPDYRADTGRVRVFRQLRTLEELEAVDLAPGPVLALCQQHELEGLVLYHRQGREVVLRAFLASTRGHEDAATGGAVLGVLGVLAAHDPGLIETPERWSFHQGRGSPRHRGMLVVEPRPDAGMLAVGGQIALVAHGEVPGV